MSTSLINDANETVAVRFFGGAARGPMVTVNMPESVARSNGDMRVREENADGDPTTLGAWISDMISDGRLIQYGGAASPLR
jgi:hypothetical protein